MKYVFYNIRNLIKNEKLFLAIMVVCIFVSAWAMLFSYGLYQNYNTLKIESDIENKEMHIPVAEKETLTRGELKMYLDTLPDTVLDDVDIIYASPVYMPEFHSEMGTGIRGFFSRFELHNGVYKTSSALINIWEESDMIISGRFFYDEEEMNGSNSVIIDDRMVSDSIISQVYADFFIDDNTANIFDMPFTIIGTADIADIVIPFLSIPEDEPMAYFGFSFENILSRKKYDILLETANEIVPNKLVFPEFPLPDEEQTYIYNNIILISALIAALTIVNFAFLYTFILKKRSRQLAVMRICGLTAMRARFACIGECCAICVPVFLIGIVTYIPFMHGTLSGIFEFMEEAYSPAVYGAIFAIYVVMLLLIMGAALSRQIGRKISRDDKKEVG